MLKCLKIILYCFSQLDIVLVLGIVFNRHQWDSGAAESREAVSCLQILPDPLSGDGRGEKRIRQRTAAGRKGLHPQYMNISLLIYRFFSQLIVLTVYYCLDYFLRNVRK